jgi:general secretion pathway protein D
VSRPTLPLRRRLGGPALALLLAACAAGSQFHSEGMRLLAVGDRDAAIAQLREANRQEPTNSRYKLDLLNEQAAYARELIQRADEARRGGKFDDAAALYAKAARIDPGNERALRGASELQRDIKHSRLLAEAEQALKEGRLDNASAAVKIVLTESAANAAARRLFAAIVEQQEKQDQAKAAQIAAQSILRKPVTLQFRDANLRMVFEALSRTTGLNVILDRDVRADLKTTIFVKDASVEDTVDLILLQNQLEKRTLNANTLFVYPATAAKQKEYQDLQVRTFQVTNADVKYLQTVLKTVLKIKDVSADERTNTLVVRDTPDAVAVASKVIAVHDVPDAEVMLEVEVLEVSRDRLTDIGLTLPNSFTIATPASTQTLSDFKHLRAGQLLGTPLSASLNLRLEDTDANLLASPRIRARNKEKARILIGDRVPTITNTVTPVQTGTPVITGTVQYQEVGLKLEFEPQVYNDQDVGIKISLEVSNIVKEFTDGQGGRSYQIGTRNAQTSLRLRDGETQILGGLISDQDRNTAAKVPGLGHLPMIGAIFGNNNGTHSKSELVLSITPHIVRAPALTDSSLRDIFSGTENSVRERALRLDPVGEFRSGSERAAPVAPARPASGVSSAPAPLAPPAKGAADTSSAVTAAATAPAAQPAPAAGGGNGDLSWSGPGTVRVGETFQIALLGNTLPALRDLPLSVRFDPAVLRFVASAVGPQAQRGGATEVNAKADARRGRVTIPLAFSQPSALAGDGTLVTLTFTVVAGRSQTQLIAAQVDAKNEDGSTHLLPSAPRTHQLRVTP